MFSRTSPPTTTQVCSESPCVIDKEANDELSIAAAQRVQSLTGEKVTMTGSLPNDDGPIMYSADASPCEKQAFTMGSTIRRFNRYREALPYARAAFDVNRLGDSPDDGKAKEKCLTRLPETGKGLSDALGLPEGSITDEDLCNDNTGFRAAMYRSESDGKLILVARDTQPNSMVDWKTNTDNGQGIDTDQYSAMRRLSGNLSEEGILFDVSGYSKGAGLAQEAGLMSNDSKIFIFNGAGLPNEALQRTGNSSFDSLTSRTVSYNSDGDFLTYMNETTNSEKQIANAQYLRESLAGDSLISPIEIKYRNPEVKRKNDDRHFWEDDADTSFTEDKDNYLKSLDGMIEQAKVKKKIGESFQIFPPIKAGYQEVIPDSMTKTGKLLGATKDEANIGKLYQHKMDNVLEPMEALVKNDRKTLQNFLDECG